MPRRHKNTLALPLPPIRTPPRLRFRGARLQFLNQCVPEYLVARDNGRARQWLSGLFDIFWDVSPWRLPLTDDHYPGMTDAPVWTHEEWHLRARVQGATETVRAARPPAPLSVAHILSQYIRRFFLRAALERTRQRA